VCDPSLLIAEEQIRSMNSRSSNESDDVGAPLPDFRATNIQLQTIAPALGVPSIPQHRPDYLEYDAGGRGVIVTMFANTGLAYLIGTGAGGIYGFRHGLAATPSTRFRVQLNSVLNHSGRYGSRAGNTLGVFSVLYSLYEGLFDYVRENFSFKPLLGAHCGSFSSVLSFLFSKRTIYSWNWKK
jgi:Tim17/Tim22/Tim23/Pmp24 family